MSKTYLDYFGLKTRPFENTCVPRLFVNARQHKEALERLLYIVRDGNMGFGLLTGEIGCGKTLLAKVLKTLLDWKDYETILLPHTPQCFRDVAYEILCQMRTGHGRRPLPDLSQLHHESDYELASRFSQLLQSKVVRTRKHMVLILDEAQQLSKEALVQLKGFLNCSELDQNYLTIILVGQAELYETMEQLPQIDQRIGLRYHIKPLPKEELEYYIQRRLTLAGYRGAGLFTREAIKVLYEETQGFPREINRICKLCLDRSFVGQQRMIDDMCVRTVIGDVFRQSAQAY